MAGATAVVAHSYHAALFGLRAGVPTVLAAASPYYRAKALGLARLAGLDPGFAVEPGAEHDVGSGLDSVAAELQRGAGLTAATDAVAAWWSAAVPDLLGGAEAAPDAEDGQLLSAAATPTNGHTLGSFTGGGGVGRMA